MKDWLTDVMQSFENVKAHFDDMAAELKSLKIAQACQSSVGSGSGADGPRIRNGVLFPAKSPNGRDMGDSSTGEPLGDETLKIVSELQKQITKLEVMEVEAMAHHTLGGWVSLALRISRHGIWNAD